MAKKEITLRQYVKAEHERLDAFRSMWERMSDCNNDEYPSSLEPGEWVESFIAFHHDNPLQPNVEASGARPLTVANHRRSRASAGLPGYGACAQTESTTGAP